MMFDVKIPTASFLNMTSKFYAWRPLAAERLQKSEISRRISIALIEFLEGMYMSYMLLQPCL